jgi:mannose/fructose/N-acetylgalactosamine-specific phosphotransferase system component IIB
MNIKVFRIDDRLIHGQIVTSWISDAEAEKIIVVDDLAAKDEFQQSLLRMATPSSIKLCIYSIEDFVEKLKNDNSSENVLLIVRGPAQALKLLEGGLDVDTINVGNISMKKGKKKVLPFLWLDDSEVNSLKEIANKNVKLDVRSIPNNRSQDAIDLINKYY